MDFHIKEAREQAGFSQKELAKIVGVAPSTFNGYENGSHDPKSALLVKIAAACNVSVDFLLGRLIVEQKSAPPITGEALELAKDYSALDLWGKRAVRQLTDTELDRLRQSPRFRMAASAHEGQPDVTEMRSQSTEGMDDLTALPDDAELP